MEQLKMKNILKVIADLQAQGMSLEEIAELPVYIGDDDELNGIHTGWYAQLVDPNNEDDADFIELINEDCCNIEMQGKAILIS